MYKKTVTYKNFNDQTITEDLYFNLSKDNLIKLLDEQPNMADDMKAAFDREDGPAIFAGIRILILKSYGIKSDDGKSFSKKVNGVPLEDTFEDTAAYSAIMDAFLDNLDDGAAFFMGIFPQDLMKQAQAEMAKEAAKEAAKKAEKEASDDEVDQNQLELTENEESASVDDVPTSDEAAETPNFATMTPEEFDHWRRSNS